MNSENLFKRRTLILGSTPATFVILCILTMWNIGCSNSDGGKQPAEAEIIEEATNIPPFIYDQRSYTNSIMQLGAKVEIAYSIAVTGVAYAQWGNIANSLPYKSNDIPIEQSQATIILDILGLQPSRSYYVQGCLENSTGEKTCGTPQIISTMTWPAYWPTPRAETLVDNITWTTEEVICYFQKDHDLHLCVNRGGNPVWYYSNPELLQSEMFRPLSNGDFAVLHYKAIAIVGKDGTVKKVIELDDINSQMVGNFGWFHHDLIQIQEGRWKGAIAVLGATGNDVTFPPVSGPVDSNDYLSYDLFDSTEPVTIGLLGDGIAVIDPETGELLWSWTVHGTHNDSISVDPENLPYTRWGLSKYPAKIGIDWTHSNALLHGVDEGGDFFWLSMRQQSWVVKVDVETGKIAWRFGYGGDFELVDDIDSPYPNPVSIENFSYYQHSPEWAAHQDGRYDFLMFDNGNLRPRPAENPYDVSYSRAVRYILDENSMRAQQIYDYGSSNPSSAAHFYSPGVCDFDLMPDGNSTLLTVGFGTNDNIFVTQLSYPDSTPLWRLESVAPGEGREYIYRAIYFPSLYETTWQYE
jgi:Arylsulfotransferase (ASST)